jgi:polyvinyl alcohol dehydrogenase (cytochrome)
MKIRAKSLLCVLLAAFALSPAAVLAAAADPATPTASPGGEGAQIWAQRCSACHDHAQDRIPPRVLIATTRAPEDIIDTLTLGAMRPQATGLTADQIRSIAVYLTGRQPSPRASPDANPCPAPADPALSPHDWRSWGRDLVSSRYQPDGGLSAAQVPKLKLRWTFAFPGRAAFGQPAVVGNMILAGGTGGRVFALNADTGCTYWSYVAGALVRTGILIGELTAAQSPDHLGHLAAWFGDDSGVLHAVDVKDGKRLWTQRLDSHPIARLVGTPQLYSGVLYAPVSSFEEVAAADPNYHCCTFRGSLVAVNAGSGKILWQSYTIRRPAVAARAASGKELTGPAGGSIFSSPTIDAKRNLIYVGTGDSYTSVESDSTDAILALRRSDGKRMWTRQVLKGDAWIFLCKGQATGNCPAPLGPDFDFSSSPMLMHMHEGRELLVAGAKSGTVYGFDALAHGNILWARPLVVGSNNGGILWGPATDGERAYVATSEYSLEQLKGPGALYALDPLTGEVLWKTPTPEDSCGWGTLNCAHALLAGVSMLPGVVFAGAMDGHIRAYDAKDGRIIWTYDTGGNFDAVNGIQGHGGAIDYGGQVIAHGMLFVISGSMRQPGNLLLAFAPE